MKIKAEERRYYGDTGWPSDPKLFAEVAATWQQWLGEAKEHLYAAQILLPHIQERHRQISELMRKKVQGQTQLAPSLDGVYFLHCAFTLENSFKGVIASALKQQIQDQADKTNKIPKILLGHDLIELATKAGYQVDIDEEFTLSFLSRQGIWAGRYPTPIKNEDNHVTHKLSDGNHYMMGGYNPEHLPAFVFFAETIHSWARHKVRENNCITQDTRHKIVSDKKP